MRKPCLSFSLGLRVLMVTAGCGARSALLVPETTSQCVPVADQCGAVELCGNGSDDNCNSQVDEGCACTPGAVQACFAGPPGRRNVGACRDGAQICQGSGGNWGPCIGGIVPRADVCGGQDSLCTGCSQRRDCPISCPGLNDPRVPDTVPFAPYSLRGSGFYPGMARSWRWSVQGGPCDNFSRRRSFDLNNAQTQNAMFVPRLSGDYTVTLNVETVAGTPLSCNWLVHVGGPGLRIELCYPESETIDLDLYLHRPGSTEVWFPTGDVHRPSLDVCGWHNCEASIRGEDVSGRPIPRVDWGYPNSPLSECINGPQGDQWRALGFCSNPRLDIDNNLDEGTGVPENINLDNPRPDERFRVMVYNFSGTQARPLINVYCGGRRVATYGSPPDEVPRFMGERHPAVGALWRVADVTTRADTSGRTTCEVEPLHPPGTKKGYDVSYGETRY